MKAAVWDTYVPREDGKTMHFDIIVPDNETDPERIYAFGSKYLKQKAFKTGEISSNECRFCHMQLVPEAIAAEIHKKGYYIYEMENCQ